MAKAWELESPSFNSRTLHPMCLSTVHWLAEESNDYQLGNYSEDVSSVLAHMGSIHGHSALGYRHELHFQLAELSLAHSFKSSADF